MKLRQWRVYFEPRDIWVGIYWNRDSWGAVRELTVYVCLIPCIPIKTVWRWIA